MNSFKRQLKANVVTAFRRRVKKALKCSVYWNSVNHWMLEDDGIHDTEDTIREINDLIKRNNKNIEIYKKILNLPDRSVFKLWFKLRDGSCIEYFEVFKKKNINLGNI